MCLSLVRVLFEFGCVCVCVCVCAFFFIKYCVSRSWLSKCEFLFALQVGGLSVCLSCCLSLVWFLFEFVWVLFECCLNYCLS